MGIGKKHFQKKKNNFLKNILRNIKFRINFKPYLHNMQISIQQNFNSVTSRWKYICCL